MKALLEKRKSQKDKKPSFTRQDNHKKPKLGNVWRKPKGLQSKMRLKKKGYKRSPEPGWGSPAAVKGLSPEGLMPVQVFTEDAIASLDPKVHGAVLPRTMGRRKRVQIIGLLLKKKITILNVKDPAAYVAAAQEAVKKEKTKKQEKAKAKKTEVKKATAKKPEAPEDPEDKKKQEKAEKDKILTKKE